MPYYILLVSSSEQQTCFIHTKNTETLPMCLRYTVRKNIWVINGISNSYVQQTVGFLVAQWEKNLPAMQETQEIQVQFLDREDPLEEGMATHSSIPAWRIPWTEEPGRLQSMWSQRVRHNWPTKHSTQSKGQASLVAQLVKNPLAMQEPLAWFLGWEDFLEKG